MVQGKAHKYPDNVDTDVIIPARYLNTADHKELAAHCMEDIDAQFKHNVKPGDVMAAGWNFGCGSSREHAPIAIRESGVEMCIRDSSETADILSVEDNGIGVKKYDLPYIFQKGFTDVYKRQVRYRPFSGYKTVLPGANAPKADGL